MWLLAKGLDHALRDKALGRFRYKNRRFAYAVRNKIKSSNFEGVSVRFICLLLLDYWNHMTKVFENVIHLGW